MHTKHWGIIYCLKEGSHRMHKRLMKIHNYLSLKGVQSDYGCSEDPGSVQRLAAMMTNNGYPTIIIVGGDAAINDAINGIMHTDSPHPALGIIPDGFGNDFAHYFSFEESNYRRTIDALFKHRTRRIDVGSCLLTTPEGSKEKRYFLNCVNIG